MENTAIFPNGDTLTRKGKALIITLGGPRRVLSTSQWMGGLRDDIKYIYNFDLKDDNGYCQIEEDSYSEALKGIASKLGLDPLKTTGLTTAVTMDDAAVVTKEARGMSVTAIATAGIENNGGCAGDPGSYAEEDNGFVNLTGTINILVLCNVNMSHGTMVQALTTVVEAKTAAVRDLELPSLYSRDLATGSGTDGVVLVGDLTSPLNRSDSGKHSLLGELIGSSVREAVKQGLVNHTAAEKIDRSRQSVVLKGLDITLDGFVEYLQGKTPAETVEKIWTIADANVDCGAKAGVFAGICRRFPVKAGDAAALKRTVKEIFSVDIDPDNPGEAWYAYLMKTHSNI